MTAVASHIGREDHKRFSKLMKERERRRMDALRLYRPMPTQLPFHESRSRERIVRGGNRCLGGEQLIYDPVLGQMRRIDLIRSGFHVLSKNPVTGQLEPAKASRPFVKAIGDLYRIVLSNGESLVSTLDHMVVGADGKWRPLRSFLETRKPIFCETGGVQGVPECHIASKHEECNSGSIRSHQQSLGHSCLPVHTVSEDGAFSALFSADSVRQKSFSGQSWTISGSIQRGSFSDDLHSIQIAPGSQDCCWRDSHLYDGPLPLEEAVVSAFSPLSVDAPGRSHWNWRTDGLVCTEGCIPIYQQSDHLSSQGVLGRALAHGAGSEFRICGASFEQSGMPIQFHRQSAGSSFARSHTSETARASQGFAASHPPEFRVGNCCKNCHIISCEWLRQGLVWDVTVEPFSNYVAAGLINANSGKSTAAFVEVASAATGIPLSDPNGVMLPYQWRRPWPLRIWCIGYGQDHIGDTIYRMLFEDDVFRIIRDTQTGFWRSWNPLDPDDESRKDEVRYADPLIPPRMIDNFAWEDKGRHVFSVCRLKNGVTIHAYTSKGTPKQGDPVDLIHIDEDIEYPHHVAEWQARLADRKGSLIWSAFPHSKNEALMTLSERAEQCQDDPEPDVSEIVLKFSDNPFIEPGEKDKMLRGWEAASIEERRARDEGEFQTEHVMMYPHFTEDIHCLPYDTEEQEQKIDKLLRQRGGQIPEDWCRYLVLDPGHSIAAVLFAAVPPDDFGDHVVCYDELYLRQYDAERLAREVLLKVQGRCFEEFIIDLRAGRQTPTGFSKTVRQQYSEALERHGIRSRSTGSGFVNGSDNVPAGIEAVRNWMVIRSNGTTKLKIWQRSCPNLVKELIHYKKTIIRDTVQDKPAPGQKDHLCDCLRYLAARDPEYVKPNAEHLKMSPVFRAFQERKDRRIRKEDRSVHMGPSTPPVIA